ncbi:hypothetical protein FA15DRAFT_665138 [Coprinopsis marcescibilis]|uniref:Uncharacterized protein n=1 Tax=Coprinopsis marcescibilis TaxID=230819 RepID=A0A5C3L6P9_COPMA|nr:hypothetical protein FA15DRAFT_665138 [Coprinopsis marcescibilis]
MSLSVDDLISSFSSSHIGQEASDLAKLQAQLAESLFGVNNSSFASSSSRFSHHPCTTPTARTPSSSSFNWESIDAFAGQARSRSSSISRRMEDVEDELMVEELLMPATPSSSVFENGNQNTYSSYASSASYAQPSSSYSSTFHQSQPRTFTEPLPSSPSQPSMFASTDPFFLQAQANSQSYFYNANLTQRGRPSQNSPFVQAAAGFHGYHNPFQQTAATAF